MKKTRILTLLITTSLILSSCGVFRPKEPKPEYQEAFQEMCEILDEWYEKRTKILKLSMTKEEYETRKAAVEKKLPDASTEAELYCLLQEFAAGFQENHTVVYTNDWGKLEGYHCLPYSFDTYEGEFYLSRCPDSKAEYLGWKLCGINQDSIEEICEKMRSFLSAENDYCLKMMMPHPLVSADVLEYLGIIEDVNGEIVFILENPDTKEKEKLSCEAMNYRQAKETDGIKLSRKVIPVTSMKDIYRSIPLKDGVYFIQINQHVEDEEYSLHQFKNQVLADLELYKPEKIILDLRYSPGGYDELFGAFMADMEKWLEQNETEVYTLISNGTGSAAVIMAVESQNRFDSILVGEPTGQRANFNAYVEYQKLGSTPLIFVHPTVYIRTIEGGDDLETLEPDILVPQTMEDWKNGVDAAVEAVLAIE